MDQFLLVFDYRSDHGPRRVGMFSTRGQAQDHIDRLNLPDATYQILPVTHVETDRPGHTWPTPGT